MLHIYKAILLLLYVYILFSLEQIYIQVNIIDNFILFQDLNKFLTDAPNGFIYISLGTNIFMSDFSQHVINAFHDVFASLPCKIVWKIGEELRNKSDNIYTAKWLPQQSLLGKSILVP